jgi:hypothetical protein
MNSVDVSAPEDKLDLLRSKAMEVRETDQFINNLEWKLEQQKEKRTKLLREELPALMDEMHVPSITIDAQGNLPAVKLTVKPFYSANVSAKWEPERRAQAYRWLEDHDAGDLIKTTIEISFPRELRSKALELVQMLKTLNDTGIASVSVDERIHAGTLTAWLKESVEAGGDLPPLDVIGGSVGRVVKIEDVKK